MKFFSFEILIEKDSEDPGYFAYSPSLPGCFGSGATIEEAKRSMREAVSQHIEVPAGPRAADPPARASRPCGGATVGVPA